MENNRENKKNGRPRKELTIDQMAQVEALAQYLSIEQLADYLKISRVTFYQIMKRNPEVSERYKKGRANAVAAISTTLIKKAMSGDVASMIFYLKTQAGWKEKQEIEISEKKSTDDFDEFLKNVNKK